MSKRPSEPAIKRLVRSAWQLVAEEQPSLMDLYARDCYHIERALSFRLGIALDRCIQEARLSWTEPWSSVVVDSELHRAHDGRKLDGTEAPDLIVHARGHDDANLLALELKHEADPDARDMSKLIRLLTERRYAYAWGVRLGVSSGIELLDVVGV